MSAILGIAALAAIVLATSHDAEPNTHLIRRDSGGLVSDYYGRAERYAENDTAIVIDGVCASACVLFLHDDFDLDVCATENARIGFHMPYTTTPAGRIHRTDPHQEHRYQLADAIVQGLPPALQDAFALESLPDAHEGNRPHQMIWVTGAAAQDAIGAC